MAQPWASLTWARAMGITQRLTRAFAKLLGEGPAASIRAVALACGYRQTSQFSTEGDQGQG